MKLADVRRKLQLIQSLSGDAELAHMEEKALYESVLETIASARWLDSPAVLANEALKAREIRFPRWFA